MSQRHRRALLTAFTFAAGCGGTPRDAVDPPPVVEAFLESYVVAAELREGKLAYVAQASTPANEPPTGCHLTLKWQGPRLQGELAAQAPTEADDPRSFVWRLELPIPETEDALGIDGVLTCGARTRSFGVRYVMSAGGKERYCGLCTEHRVPPTTASPPNGRGLWFYVRAGVAARAEDETIVDTCKATVIVDARGKRGVRVGGSIDAGASEAELLFAHDHGEDVCGVDRLVRGGFAVEGPIDAVGAIFDGLRASPDVARIEPMGPPPG